MSKRCRSFARHPNDYYPTISRRAAEPLIPFLERDRITSFAEPCAGTHDLVALLEDAGFHCAYAGDLKTGQDALELAKIDLPIVTNPPWEWPLLRELIVHFLGIAPYAWLLLPYPWTAAKRVAFLMRHCSDVVLIGRLKWIAGSKHTSKDDFCWCRFDIRHSSGPILHPRGSMPALTRVALCEGCGRQHRPTRIDARYCGGACRQAAYRGRNAAVTPAAGRVP